MKLHYSHIMPELRERRAQTEPWQEMVERTGFVQGVTLCYFENGRTSRLAWKRMRTKSLRIQNDREDEDVDGANQLPFEGTRGEFCILKDVSG